MTSSDRAANNEKINVLFVIVQLKLMGGSESLLRSLIGNIDRDRFNPSVAWFYGDEPMREYVELGIPLHYVPKIKRFDLEAIRRLSQIIEDCDIDVVNAHHFLSMVYAYYGCKIKNHRGLIYTEHSEWEIDGITWKWAKVGGYMLSRSEKSIGVGENVTKKLRSKFGLRKAQVTTINNGVDIKSFRGGDQSLLLRRQLGIAPDDKVIGVVANFRKVKNHMFLLRAFKSLLERHKEAKLLLVGSEPAGDIDNTLPEVREFIESQDLKDNAYVLGYRADVPELLRIMDVFCLTSMKEGLPIGLIEAMAVGLPVVGTNVDGIRDTIVDGTNGFLVELDDQAELVDAMDRLLSDEMLRNDLGRAASRIAMSEYSLRDCVDKYQREIVSACVR